ncbi:uncharacterized protein [Setaria viridis]|uniref:AB hydrolase-1 domain-containing protein n=1 Tax=Setaria viridis TaxID=4556 RepID=A0A4U6T7U0_SETVI|nr:2-hydroxymuconate semialdehyde hydrolase-like isoform X2 [Setaria viridis]TKV97899.1 hypothetical protein SEVIR_9G524400v2 [Setaria viridis]
MANCTALSAASASNLTSRFSPLALPRAPAGQEAVTRTRPSPSHRSLAAMGFSILPLMEFIARRAFLGAGLQPHTAALPSDDGSDGGQPRTVIHYWAPPGEPRLPPLLLIHGFGPMATWQWRRQVGPLSRHFHVIVPDLLGFGASSRGSPAAPSELAQAAALAALLDALPGLTADARVAAIGTSYGGFVAYALARAAGPGRVGPVVMSNSDLLKTAEDDRALLERAGGGLARTADLLMPLDARGARRLMELSFYRRQAITLLPDFVLRQAVQQLFMDKRDGKIELMKAITVGTDEFKLTPLPQDVLLIWGDHDQIFPLEKAFAVKRWWSAEGDVLGLCDVAVTILLEARQDFFLASLQLLYRIFYNSF